MVLNMILLFLHGFCWWRFVAAALILLLYSKANFSVGMQQFCGVWFTVGPHILEIIAQG